MLDNNTNKVVWVGVAVGLVVVLGVAGTVLYPEAMNNGASMVRNLALSSANYKQNLLVNMDGSFKTQTTPNADYCGWQHSNDYKEWTIEVPAHGTWTGIFFDVDLKKNFYVGDKYTIKSDMQAESEGLKFSPYGGMYLEVAKTEKTSAVPHGAVSTNKTSYFAQGTRVNSNTQDNVPVLGKPAGGPDDNSRNHMCIYFENSTDHSIKVHVSNIQLYRGWVD